MKRTAPDPALVNLVEEALRDLRDRHVKRSREYTELKALLRPKGYKPFDIFATYNYVAGSTQDDWEASVRLAAYVANRR